MVNLAIFKKVLCLASNVAASLVFLFAAKFSSLIQFPNGKWVKLVVGFFHFAKLNPTINSLGIIASINFKVLTVCPRNLKTHNDYKLM